jgi:hypothetical protein
VHQVAAMDFWRAPQTFDPAATPPAATLVQLTTSASRE